ncbi:4-deoxy-L-threo-5-hexosulose-uronate ketol-isomerase [Alkalihalobacillus xiaoxiensis]|uniref:4-deoxy-L-threo-5-hexosulose-uronate ketol-isomerase n=1 Tax=Shouchella xiaoxiensis TaxID=766895 RepID=A0ABS2SZL8_9BACI|nr:5-dehydro-4-deoxy-D-glucuronate isomerase [Shouchella xiaoxiensis]MBM7840695.1 4-deoxy-L-threo-5-hexosulose-uronate ketol-isomerase [Shouchella xiaoxiensis]
MKTLYPHHPEDVRLYTTNKLRDQFLMEKVFISGEWNITYSHVDRIIYGGVMPIESALQLPAGDSLSATYFLERRELGTINIGGAGYVHVDGSTFEVGQEEALYIGKGAKDVSFESVDSNNPAKFYINSCPAHHTYETRVITKEQAQKRALGTKESMNERVINQYIHPDVLPTCQLTMGMTELAQGSGWNTMPSHTHERRMEVYFYFNMAEDTNVFHLMGQPEETRHLVVRNEQAVLSPSWSIHSGTGTANYTFIWGMCGENQDFDDMDFVPMQQLR